jgi:hypothetical protein
MEPDDVAVPGGHGQGDHCGGQRLGDGDGSAAGQGARGPCRGADVVELPALPPRPGARRDGALVGTASGAVYGRVRARRQVAGRD